MITLNECLTDDTRVLLVPFEQEKKFFPFFKNKEKKIYRKRFNHAEFVGENLCEIRNLRCAHYFVIGEGSYNVNRSARYGDIQSSMYQFKLGSYDFKNPGYEYFDLSFLYPYHDDYSTLFEKVLSLAPNSKNRKELLDEIEEMFALDIYMGQTDRIATNIMFQRNPVTREVHLAPLYDFQYSLKSGYIGFNSIYDTPLISFDKDEQLKDFIKEHPEFAEKLAYYLDVDLAEVVRWSYRGKGLRVPESKFPYYKDFDQDRKELIRKFTR